MFQSGRFSSLNDRYRWGVGSSPGLDDILAMKLFHRSVKAACAPVVLVHNKTYYSVVEAKNSALNAKSVQKTSNGGIAHFLKSRLTNYHVDCCMY